MSFLSSLKKIDSPARIPAVAAGMALITFIIYFNSLFGAFIFDDGHAIVDNPAIRPPLSFKKILSPLPPGPI